MSIARRRRGRSISPLGVCAWVACACIVWATAARAEEPLVPNEPRVMREPGEVVDVPDAVDDRDPFDVELALAYRLDVYRGSVVRGAQDEHLADVTQVASRLVPEIRVGIFRDLAGIARLPIVLTDQRDVKPIEGSDGVVSTTGGESLFALPLRAPERSGVENLTFGLIGAVMNQTRQASFPNWTIGAEAQVSLGPALVACNDDPAEGQVRCAHPGDVNRDGERGEDEPDAKAEQDPGISRGTAALVLHTTVSRRIRYVEPFGTLRARFEFPLPDTPLDQEGSITTLPIRGDAELGLGIIPWENRERFSRVWIDARVIGSFATRGRDYSPLFDALGSSAAASLRSPRSTSIGRAYETGISTVDAHGTLGAAGSFIWRASQLIRLGVALAVEHEFEHVLTGDEPEEVDYRPALDDDAGRYSIASSVIVRVNAAGAVTF